LIFLVTFVVIVLKIALKIAVQGADERHSTRMQLQNSSELKQQVTPGIGCEPAWAQLPDLRFARSEAQKQAVGEGLEA